MIYADNAATTKVDPRVVAAMTSVFEEDYGNPSSQSTAGTNASRRLVAAREEIALLLGCSPHGVYFTSGGSESNNQALATMVEQGQRRGRNKLVVSAIEHPSVLKAADFWERHGVEVVRVNPDENGVVSVSRIADVVDDNTCGVSLMLANNETGALQPVGEVARVAHSAGAFMHTDAVQAAGRIAVNFDSLGVDLLSISSHKFCGPKGAGALLCRRGIELTQLIFGGGQERGSRAGTENTPGIVGMAEALGIAVEHMDAEAMRITQMRDALEKGVLEIPGTRLLSGDVERLPGISNICFEGLDRQMLVLLMDRAGVCVSAGSACSAGAVEPSHVLTAMGVPKNWAMGSIRFSLGTFNTIDEVPKIIDATKNAVAKLR